MYLKNSRTLVLNDGDESAISAFHQPGDSLAESYNIEKEGDCTYHDMENSTSPL